jgi:hypothetical protein
MDDRQRWRTVPYQPSNAIGAYEDAELWEGQQREINAREGQDAIAVWLRGQNLLKSALGGSQRYRAKNVAPDDAVGKAAFGLNAQLVLLAARTSKPALDLILGSYYTEAFALERSMLESWGRAVYVRLRKEEYPRWYQPYTDSLGDALPKREPKWEHVRDAIQHQGSPEDKAHMVRAQPVWDILNLGAHPSGHAIDQVYDSEINLMKFYPESEWQLRAHALAHGTLIQGLVLREVEGLGPHAEGWLQHLGEFLAAAETVSEVVRRDLDRLSNALAAERTLRKRLNEEAKQRAGSTCSDR